MPGSVSIASGVRVGTRTSQQRSARLDAAAAVDLPLHGGAAAVPDRPAALHVRVEVPAHLHVGAARARDGHLGVGGVEALRVVLTGAVELDALAGGAGGGRGLPPTPW